jgi:trehalose/maltose hydrolase-like predicted phosphorylase
MAGTIDIIVENFAGINLFRDRIVVNPDLPRSWNRLAFNLVHRDNLFHFEIVPGLIRVRKEPVGAGGAEQIDVQVGRQTHTLNNETLEIAYEQKSARMPV